MDRRVRGRFSSGRLTKIIPSTNQNELGASSLVGLPLLCSSSVACAALHRAKVRGGVDEAQSFFFFGSVHCDALF